MMLFDLLRRLEDLGAALLPHDEGIALGMREEAAGLIYEIKTHAGALKKLINRVGGGYAGDILDAYLYGFTLVNTPGGLKEAVKRLSAAASIAIDLETTGLDPREDQIRLISIAGPLDTYVVDVKALYGIDIGEALRPLFKGKPTLILHNSLFDLEFLAYKGLEANPRALYDTGIAEQVIRGASFMPSLKTLAKYYLGLELDKTPQTSNWSGGLSKDQLRYAALDARTTLLVYEKQREELTRLGLERAASCDFRAIPAVVWMRMSGVPLDLSCWFRVVEEETTKAYETLNELERLAPGVNWNSPDQVKAVLQEAGLELEDTRHETLVKHANHPIVAKLLKYREHQKRVSTYGAGWEKYINPKTGRIHPSWKLLGAETGRMACTAPNLMQVPREASFRKCFKAPPGRVLVKADLSQIELRLAALIAGDKAMLEAFRKGEDLHTKTAMAVTGKPREAITKEDRQIAKSLNFGLLYGMGSETLRAYAFANYGVELTSEEAKTLREKFFQTYPGLRQWHNSQKEGPVEVRTLSGRRRVTDKFTEKLNSPIQGSGADLIKIALALLYERRGQMPGVFPILAVHDELVVEAPAHQGEAARAHLVRAMLDAAQELTGGGVPIEVEAGVYTDWSAQEAVRR